jgi:hypothetical protein
MKSLYSHGYNNFIVMVLLSPRSYYFRYFVLVKILCFYSVIVITISLLSRFQYFLMEGVMLAWNRTNALSSKIIKFLGIFCCRGTPFVFTNFFYIALVRRRKVGIQTNFGDYGWFYRVLTMCITHRITGFSDFDHRLDSK